MRLSDDEKKFRAREAALKAAADYVAPRAIYSIPEDVLTVALVFERWLTR